MLLKRLLQFANVKTYMYEPGLRVIRFKLTAVKHAIKIYRVVSGKCDKTTKIV